MTLTIKNPDENCLREVGRMIKEGKVCIYPTETCYGLGTNALDKEAVGRIYEIKKRDKGKKLTCIVSSLEMAEKYCVLSEAERRICKELMPGPITVVAEKRDNVPDVLNHDFVFRIPSNKIARRLSEESEVPIVSTSANFSGAKNNYSVKDISLLIRENTDFIVDCGKLAENDPSTLVKIEDGDLKVLRQGPVSEKQIKEATNTKKQGKSR